MASSREADTLEAQNDHRLDELHSKLRTLRGVTADIHNDVERQNLMLDHSSNYFESFRSSLSQSAQRAARTFGLNGGMKQWRLLLYCAGAIVCLWFIYKIFSWFHWPSS